MTNIARIVLNSLFLIYNKFLLLYIFLFDVIRRLNNFIM